jgi:hypothetical protein
MDDQPVTRKELLEALAAFKTDILEAIAPLATKAEMAQAMAANKAEILETAHEFVRDAQTEILRGFHTYQQSADLRIRTVEAKMGNVDAGLSQRVDNVERRLWEIERKLLLNPPAA